MTVIRNPFPPDLKEEITKIIEPSIFKIKRNINVKYVNNAAIFVDEKALINALEDYQSRCRRFGGLEQMSKDNKNIEI